LIFRELPATSAVYILPVNFQNSSCPELAGLNRADEWFAAGRLQLKRPLVAFNVETTGLDTASDRIVQFNAVGMPTQDTLRCALCNVADSSIALHC
jgi:DNA polymerase III epsilon subunit-like protein